MSADHLRGGRGACDEVEESLAEMALGILPGDQRALVLNHLDGCDRCQAEVERLTLSADTLLQLAPEVEPPVGFEVGLFERMGVTEPDLETHVARRRLGGSLARLSGKGRVVIATAAATLAVALGFGGGWLANPGASMATQPYEHDVQSETATLSSDAHAVGTVSAFAGTPSWMLMTVHGTDTSGWVTCEVTVANGKQVTVGTFRLDNGYGAWSARLPVSVSDIRSARVVTPSGTVLGSATFTA